MSTYTKQPELTVINTLAKSIITSAYNSVTKRKRVYVAIDLGNGNVKVMTSEGVYVLQINFWAKADDKNLPLGDGFKQTGIVPASDDMFWGYEIKETEEKDEDLLNQGILLWGPGVVKADNPQKTKARKKRYEAINFRIMAKIILGTVVRLSEEKPNEPVEVYVNTGLPASERNNEDDVNAIRNAFKGDFTIDVHMPGGVIETKKINCPIVIVNSQPRGSYNSVVYELKGERATKFVFNGQQMPPISSSNVLVCDGGFGTLDYDAFIKGNNTAADRHTSKNLGMSKAWTEVVQDIQDHHSYTVSIEEVERQLRFSDKFVKGGLPEDHPTLGPSDVIDCTEYKERAFKRLAEKIIKDMADRYEEKLDEFAYIFVTGGVATPLFPYLYEVASQPEFDIQNKLYLVPDAQMANAQGFLSELIAQGPGIEGLLNQKAEELKKKKKGK